MPQRRRSSMRAIRSLCTRDPVSAPRRSMIWLPARLVWSSATSGPGSIASRRPFRNVFPNVGGIAFTMNAGTTDYRAVHVLLSDGSTGVGARARRIRSPSRTALSRTASTRSVASHQAPTRSPALLDAIVFERGPSPTASASGTSGQDIRHRMVISSTMNCVRGRSDRRDGGSSQGGGR